MDRSRKGVGGFFESILAMMLVTIGMVLITSSIALFSKEVKENDGNAALENRCLGIRDELLSNLSVMNEDCLSYQRIIFLKAGELRVQSGFGFFISVIERSNDGPMLLISLNNSQYEGIGCVAVTAPITIQHAPNDMRAGLLTVCLWEE